MRLVFVKNGEESEIAKDDWDKVFEEHGVKEINIGDISAGRPIMESNGGKYYIKDGN